MPRYPHFSTPDGSQRLWHSPVALRDQWGRNALARKPVGRSINGQSGYASR